MKAAAERTGVLTLVVGAVVFLVLAVTLVPWHAVPGGSLRPVPVDTVLSPEQLDRAGEFSRWARVWSWGSLALSLAVAAWFGLTRRGRRLVEALPGPWWAQVPLAAVALTVIGRLVTLPCAVAFQRLELDSRLSEQPWRSWGEDVVKSTLIDAVLTALGVLVLVACCRRWRRAWPAVVGGLLAALVLAGSFVYPVLVEPMFNHFAPLPEGPLRAAVLDLADQEGVQVDDVLVADASRRTTTLNAYVSGFGGTRRVVLYDNLVDDEPEAVTLSVVAHELGHAKHDDVLVGTLLAAAGALFGVGLLSLVVERLRRRGFPDIGDAAAVPLVLALTAFATFAALPVQNAISRQIETRADVDALRTTQDRTAFIELQKQLAARSLTDPDPPALSQFWFGSHPTAVQRVALALRVLG